MFKRLTKKKGKYTWSEAPDVFLLLQEVVSKLNLSHVQLQNIKVYRSSTSKARAPARIWSLPSIWR